MIDTDNSPFRFLGRIACLFEGGGIARATFGVSAVLLVRLIVQAGMLLLLARLLGSSQFGLFSGIAAFAVLLGACATFGSHLVLLREVARYPLSRDDVLSFALPTSLVSGGVLFVVYLMTASWWFQMRGMDIWVLVAIGLSELLLQPMILLASAEHQANGRIAISQWQLILPLFLRLLVVGTLFVLQSDSPLYTFAAGYLAVSIVAIIVVVMRLPTAWPAPRVWRWPRSRELRSLFGFAVMNMTALAPSEIDKMVSVGLLPLTVAGAYAASTRVAGALILPVMAMMLAALPQLFRSENEDRGRSGRMLRLIFICALSYGLFGGVVLYMAGPLIEGLFGESYVGVADMLKWVALAVPAMGLRIASGSALMGLNRPWMRVWFELVGPLVLVVTAFILISELPLSGMPLALVCSEWSMAIVGWLIVGLFSLRDGVYRTAVG